MSLGTISRCESKWPAYGRSSRRPRQRWTVLSFHGLSLTSMCTRWRGATRHNLSRHRHSTIFWRASRPTAARLSSVQIGLASRSSFGLHRPTARALGNSLAVWVVAQCAGIWSPNGQQIAFDSLGEDGRFHIWLIDPDGGTPRQVTTDPGSQRGPSWSHDGQWIYYWLQQSDHSDVWRTRLSDGVKEQLTHDGKTEFGVELFDGSHFLYQTESGALMEAPLEGGSARQLVKCALLRGVRRGFERHLLRGMRTALRSPCVFAQSRDWQAAIAWAAREADAKHTYCYTWGISRRHASSLHSRWSATEPI